MAELQKMYDGKAFSPSTTLTKTIGALDTVIQVDDISVFPPAPNLATINDGDGTGETILYTALTSNSLSGCKRGFQGEAKEHNAGFEIGRYFTDYDYVTLTKNVNSLNVNKVENIPGKQLSTEDFTKEEKTKLSTLNNYDDTTIKQDINDLQKNKSNNAKSFTVTLDKSKWQDSGHWNYVQTISVPGMVSTGVPIFEYASGLETATPNVIEDYENINIETNQDSITATSNKQIFENITIRIEVLF